MYDVEVRFTALTDNAVTPFRVHDTDAGYDLTATSVVKTEQNGQTLYNIGAGLALEIPEGYAGFLFPRSSIKNTPLMLSNCVGVIDAGYRGEVKAVFRKDRAANYYADDYVYKVGDRFAQLIILPVPTVRFTQVGEISNSKRGIGGYGSTGR